HIRGCQSVAVVEVGLGGNGGGEHVPSRNSRRFSVLAMVFDFPGAVVPFAVLVKLPAYRLRARGRLRTEHLGDGSVSAAGVGGVVSEGLADGVVVRGPVGRGRLSTVAGE